MVLIRQIEAGRGLDIGSAPNIQIDRSVAEGIQQVAAGLGDVAQTARNHQLRLAEREAQMQEFQADQAFTRLGTQFAANYAERQTNIDPTGTGFTSTVNQDFNAAYDDFLGTIPANLRPKFEELALTERERWTAQAAAAENDQRAAYVAQGVADTTSAKQAEVFNAPDGYAAALQDITRLIDTAPDMSPVQRQEAKKAAAEALSLSWAQRMQQDDPQALLAATGLDSREGYYAAIKAAESSGDANAKNPNSSATGLYQFTEPTWRGLVQRYPNAGLTLDGRTDPQQQERAIRLFTDENAKTLAGAGIGQSNANLYAAHFLGAGGAVKVLQAPGQSRVANLLPQEVIDANPFLATMTVAAFKEWTQRKAGDGQTNHAAPELAALDFADRLKIYDQAQAQIQQNVTAATAQAKAQYDTKRGTLELGIVTGDVTSEQSILEAGLSADDTATLIRSLRTQQGDRAVVMQAAAAYQQGALTLDPYSTEGKKVVDGLYSVITEAATPEQAPFAVNDLIRQAGVVPAPLQNQMRAAMTSTDPAAILPMLQQGQAISDMGAGILGRRDGGAEIQSKVDLYDTYTRSMGYTPEEAAQKIAATNDPEQVKARDALLKSKPIADMLKNVSDRDVAGVFGWNTTVGENPAQNAAMVSEYKSLLEEALVDSNGDQNAAKALTATRFQRIYGKSDLTMAGGGTVTRLPPEKTYPGLPDGSLGYIRTQLEDALKAEGVEFSDVRLAAYDETDVDFQNGAPARYQVSYYADGKWQMFNLPFVASYEDGLAAYQAERAALLEQARKTQQENAAAQKQQWPEGLDGPERFSNGELYYGIANVNSPVGRAIAQKKADDAARLQEIEEEVRNQAPEVMPGSPEWDRLLQERFGAE